MAARKVRGLLECGALVTVVAPEVSEAMTELGPLTIERRRYERGEAANYRLVVTATGDAGVDEAVYADAEAAGVWVNSADDGQHCSFILPSVHRDGPVTFAVSTGGTSPALASWLRRRLTTQSGPGLDQLAELLGQARQCLHEAGRSTETVDWVALLDGPLPSLVQQGRAAEARELVEEAIGLPLSG